MKKYILPISLTFVVAFLLPIFTSCGSDGSCVHEWTEWEVVKEATCGESGYSNRQCTKCNEVDRSIQYTIPHSFSEEWKYDGSNHWHSATCIHKNEVSDNGAHSFVGNTCSVCGALRATQGLEYRGNLGEGTYRVSGIGNTLDDNIVVARYYNSCEIIGVDAEAFLGIRGLKSVVLQKYITTIGDGAFKDCTDLVSIKFTSSLESISSQMLAGCTSLEYIYFTGTRAEWDSLPKGEDWDKNTGDYTVVFSDGTTLKK